MSHALRMPRIVDRILQVAVALFGLNRGETSSASGPGFRVAPTPATRELGRVLRMLLATCRRQARHSRRICAVNAGACCGLAADSGRSLLKMDAMLR